MNNSGTGFHELFGRNLALSTPVLLAFGEKLDRLGLQDWIEIGHSFADFRSAVAFSMVNAIVKSTVGVEWDDLSKIIQSEAQQYIDSVIQTQEVVQEFCGWRINNIGPGIAGAVGELLAGNALDQHGLPIFFFGMFDRVGITVESLTQELH